MDLVEVSDVVTAIQASVSEIQKEVTVIRSATAREPTSLDQQELVRFEADASSGYIILVHSHLISVSSFIR